MKWFSKDKERYEKKDNNEKELNQKQERKTKKNTYQIKSKKRKMKV